MKNTTAIHVTKILVSFLIPLIFFIGVLLFSHFWEVFEYDTDEGFCLMRAFLHAKGYSLYKDIWMDAPPFLILLLSSLFKICGSSIFYARALILTFSALLLWGIFQIICKTQNFLSALFTVALIVTSSSYVRLSVSVMIGFPAVALAILSSYFIFLYQTHYQRKYLLLSGCLLALALQTKFFVIVFLPAIICEIVIIERSRFEKRELTVRSLSSILYWSIALAAVYLYVAFVATSVDFSQIIQLYARGRKLINVDPGYRHVQKWILQEYDSALLAIGAFIFLRRHESNFFFIPFISFILGVFVFSMHSPIWYHHRLLVIIPMCWLASFSFYKLFDKQLWTGWQNKTKMCKIRDVMTIVFLSFALMVTVARTPLKYKRMAGEMGCSFNGDYRHVLYLLEQYKKETRFVVTDRPIFAFYANLPVHPYLVTSSYKRIATGLLTSKDFIDIIREEQPELVLFARFPWLRDEIVPQIKEQYELEYKNPDDSLRLYVLKKIKKYTENISK